MWADTLSGSCIKANLRMYRLLGRGLLHERPWQLLHASHLLGSSRFLLLAPAVARAQDFGVAESAETIDRGTFKFKANPEAAVRRR